MKKSLSVFLTVLALVFLASCGDDGPAGPKDPTELEFAAFLGVNLDEMSKTELGTYYKDLVVGDGPTVAAGDSITVHYEGWLHDGTKFDSSRDRGEPASFSLNQVILGWQDGVPGMKVGGVRKLVIPPQLAYGSQGAGGGLIPPNATLVFDIELLEIHTQ